MATREVFLENGVEALMTPLEVSLAAHARNAEEAHAGDDDEPVYKPVSPYTWRWIPEVRENGDIVIVLDEYEVAANRHMRASVAGFSAAQIVAELMAHWRRPSFAHITAEGKLARRVDTLRQELAEAYAKETDNLARARSSRSESTHGPVPSFSDRRPVPSEGLLTQEVVRGLGGTTVRCRPSGRHSEELRRIAWGLAILAALAQANQYDLPYGGQVFDAGALIREATRDA